MFTIKIEDERPESLVTKILLKSPLPISQFYIFVCIPHRRILQRVQKLKMRLSGLPSIWAGSSGPVDEPAGREG